MTTTTPHTRPRPYGAQGGPLLPAPPTDPVPECGHPVTGVCLGCHRCTWCRACGCGPAEAD